MRTKREGWYTGDLYRFYDVLLRSGLAASWDTLPLEYRHGIAAKLRAEDTMHAWEQFMSEDKHGR